MERSGKVLGRGAESPSQMPLFPRMMTTLRCLGSKARRTAASVVRPIASSVRRIPELLAFLYPVLRWGWGSVLLVVILGLASTWIWEGHSPPGLILSGEFIAAHLGPILVTMAYVVVVSCLALVGHRRKETQRRLRDAFAKCMSAQELSHADLGFRDAHAHESEHEGKQPDKRPFFGTYFPRKAVEDAEPADQEDGSLREYTEEDLEQLVRDSEGFLLIGPPFSGKTLTVCEILRRLTDYTVVTPDSSRAVPDEDTFRLLRAGKIVILLDDLLSLLSDYDLALFIRRTDNATQGRYAVVGTCRGGGDFASIATGLGNHVTLLCETLRRLRLRLMTNKQRFALAATAGTPLDANEVKNYPLPGNITMRKWIWAMRTRFANLESRGKNALRAMKLLYTSGVPVTCTRVQTVLREVFYPAFEDRETEEMLRNLWQQHCLLKEPSAEDVEDSIDFGFLDQVVSYEEGRDPADGRWETLVRAFEKGGDVEALLHLTVNQGRLWHLDRALKTADIVVRLDPGNAEGHFHRGYTLCRLHRLVEALEANDRALKIRPHFAQAYNNRAYILSSLDKLDSALEAVDRALALAPRFDDAHTNRAIVLARLGRFAEALEEFKTAIGLRESYYAYLCYGITLSRQDAFDDALGAYDEALRLRPEYPEAYMNRGITLSRRGHYEEALAAHEEAIRLRADYAEAHMNKGQTLANVGRLPEAVEALSKAIELQPDYALAYVNRARTLAKDNQLTKSLADCDCALALQSHNADAHQARGIALARLRRLEEACRALERSVSLRPYNAETYVNLGITLARLRRFENAMEAYDQAIELKPKYAQAYFEKARTLCHYSHAPTEMDRYGKAMNLLELAVTFDRAILAEIQRKREQAFGVLARHAVHGARFAALGSG